VVKYEEQEGTIMNDTVSYLLLILYVIFCIIVIIELGRITFKYCRRRAEGIKNDSKK